MKSLSGLRFAKGVKVAAKNPRKYKNVGGVGSKSSSSKSSSSSSSKSNSASQISKEENILFNIGSAFSYLILNYGKLFEKEARINKFMVIDLLRFTKKQTGLIKKKIDKVFVKIKTSTLIYIDDTSYDVFRKKHDKLITQLEEITDSFIEQYKDIAQKRVVLYSPDLRNIFVILFEILRKFFEYIQKEVKIYGGISKEDMRYVDGYIKDEVKTCHDELLEYNIYDIMEFIKQEKSGTFKNFYASVLRERERENVRRFYSIGK
jgi:hypothetical protein